MLYLIETKLGVKGVKEMNDTMFYEFVEKYNNQIVSINQLNEDWRTNFRNGVKGAALGAGMLGTMAMGVDAMNYNQEYAQKEKAEQTQLQNIENTIKQAKDSGKFNLSDKHNTQINKIKPLGNGKFELLYSVKAGSQVYDGGKAEVVFNGNTFTVTTPQLKPQTVTVTECVDMTFEPLEKSEVENKALELDVYFGKQKEDKHGEQFKTCNTSEEKSQDMFSKVSKPVINPTKGLEMGSSEHNDTDKPSEEEKVENNYEDELNEVLRNAGIIVESTESKQAEIDSLTQELKYLKNEFFRLENADDFFYSSRQYKIMNDRRIELERLIKNLTQLNETYVPGTIIDFKGYPLEVVGQEDDKIVLKKAGQKETFRIAKNALDFAMAEQEEHNKSYKTADYKGESIPVNEYENIE